MVRTLVLALALSATDALVPGATRSPRVAPMKMMETMPYSSPTAQSSSGPLGLGPRESPKIAQGADSTILVQGGSLRTWSYKSPLVNQVQVVLDGGPPADADLELWHGPDNTPCKMRVYVENGQLRPFSCVIATPRGPNTVAIRNIGQMEFPIADGPNNNKQVIELYTEDGLDRPFFAILETPGSGNVVRIVNTAPVEFP
ncbi:hypothetical protein JL722_991 [Aureococcus anophagefferens]|nr:hypothetical protein JL722_991 [Aureococcus anophagefferens]